MASLDKEDTEVENNKHSFYNRMIEDGKLVSPIDLCLESAKQLRMDNLKWTNIDVPPVRMKLTNTGETVIVSAKWATERPYLTGGPLKDSYVFSQIHFHWGSDEREGSEHTVRGICYPMEMHVVFYKTRYLTQEAALKQEDGVIIVVYLIKLANKTAAGVRWLVSQLDRVVQPHSSTPLSLSPLSSLLVPFSRDYLVYWGSLQTSRCAHTMLWHVSRAALAITLEDLNAFRKLLNSRKEPMNKNFRGSNAPMGRVVFHVNPSKETQNLLLPGTVDPPGQVMVINYTQMPILNQDQARIIFNKGDSTDHKENLASGRNEKPSECSELGDIRKMAPVQQGASSGSDRGSSLKTDCSSSTKGKSPRMSRVLALKQARQSKRNKVGTSLKERKEGIIKSDQRNEQKLENFLENTKRKGEKNPEFKSRLPLPTRGLQSSLAQYFQRPDSAPGDNIVRDFKISSRPLPEMRRAPAVTTIPRPLGRNAGKLDGSAEVKVEPPYNHFTKIRPISSPNKLLPKKPSTLT